MIPHLSEHFTEEAMNAIEQHVSDTGILLLDFDPKEGPLVLHPVLEMELEHAKKTLEAANAMTDEEANAYAQNKYLEAMREYVTTENQRHAEDNYRESMIETVKAWQPSEECVELKTSILALLKERSSMRLVIPSAPERLSGYEFRARAILEAQQSVASYEKEIEDSHRGIKKLDIFLKTARDEIAAYAKTLKD